jgi:hypothetical protein
VKDVLDMLLAGETNYDALRPDVWKQAHPEAIRIYRVEERQARADAKAVKRARRRIARRWGCRKGRCLKKKKGLRRARPIDSRVWCTSSNGAVILRNSILGLRLNQSQNARVVARATADRKFAASLS